MAQEMKMNSKLLLLFETGFDDKGKPILKTKTFSNVRKEATADEFFQAGRALGGLSSYPLVGLERADQFEIIQ